MEKVIRAWGQLRTEREEVPANLALSSCFKIPTVLWSVVTNCCIWSPNLSYLKDPFVSLSLTESSFFWANVCSWQLCLSLIFLTVAIMCMMSAALLSCPCRRSWAQYWLTELAPLAKETAEQFVNITAVSEVGARSSSALLAAEALLPFLAPGLAILLFPLSWMCWAPVRWLLSWFSSLAQKKTIPV